MCFFGPKMAHLSITNFFWYKPVLLLSSTYWPTYAANPELLGCIIFEPKMVHLPQTNFSFEKVY